MLDELLGRGLSSKCKSLIKLINSRLDTIKRKRNCSLKFLRKDVADLLTSGQEMKAFNRAEVLIAEQNLYTAYNTVEQFCASILSNLPAIQKQRECPPESMEAVASVMFAAARFADLPELRNLRGIFSERYGNVPINSAADLYNFPGCAVNKEFAELFSSKPPSTDRKLKLMREISKESSIIWDSKAFEERVKNPHASTNVTAGLQLPHWSDGQKHGDEIAHEKGNQDQSTHRIARQKNVGHDPIHAEVRQETLSHRKSQQPMERSSKTPPLYSDTITINEKDKRSHDSNRKKFEPPLRHLEEPDCVLNDTLNGNNGRKEHSRRKSVLSQGHAIKSDRQRGDMLDERFDPDIVSHGGCKERSDCETKEKWNDAADKRVEKTLSNKREPTLTISKDEAYERDERERLSHGSKPPHFFTGTTEKIHDGSYKGNAYESLPHQRKMLYKSKLSYAYNRAPEMVHEDTFREGYDHENMSHHRRQPQFDNQEKRHRRSEPRHGIRTASTDAYYNENEQEILPQRNDSPLYDDQKVCYRSKPPFGNNGTLRLHDDTPYNQNSRETSFDRTHSPLGDKKEKISRRSKSLRPYTRETDNISNDASFRATDCEILLDESQSAFECRRIKEKIEDGRILRKGKPKAQKSEAHVDRLAELDERDNGWVPIGFDVNLRTKGREKSDNSKPSIKNVKPPYVILTGQKVSYSEDADSRNDHQDADYPLDLHTKGDAEKEMKRNHNRITRPPPYVVSTKGGRPKNGAEDRGADARCEQDDEFLAEDDYAYRPPRTIRDRPINCERQGGRVIRFEQHREAIAEHDTAHPDKFPKSASIRQRHPQAFVNTDADDDYPLHHMKHDRHKSTRMVLDQREDDFHEPGYSQSRHKYMEETSHGVDGYLVDDKPRHNYKRRVQHHLNKKDDEEKIIDELLLHYSQKVTPRVANDIQVRSHPPTLPVADVNGDTSATRRSARKVGSHPRLESNHAPNRAVSFPPDPSQPEENIKSHVRATSMQPDMYNGHVHPKLPDYDDLAVRFAALRRQSNR